eukprot:tig00000681_g3061.t1
MAAHPWDAARHRAYLQAALEQMTMAHDALLFGNATLRLAGIVTHRYEPTDALLFGAGCFAEPAVLCGAAGTSVYREGLEALFLRYAAAAARLANAAPVRRAPAGTLASSPLALAFFILASLPKSLAFWGLGSVAPGDRALAFLEEANGGALQPGLLRLAALFEGESRGRLETFTSLMAILFAAVVLLLALECGPAPSSYQAKLDGIGKGYALVFRRLIERLSDEARRTVFMFLMLPAEVIEASESIKAHLAGLASTAAAE